MGRLKARAFVRQALLGSAALFVATPALAQSDAAAVSSPSDAGAPAIDEIIVTARKVRERAQDVPISITAFSNQSIRERNLTQVTDIAKGAPNVDLEIGAGNSNSPGIISASIRGIGQTDFIITQDPGVGIYVDGVYVARATGGALDLSDVETIEVLRGPQGTLFGKNTIGGALNISTMRPAAKPKADLEFDYGSFDRIDVKGLVTGPLSDAVRAKLAVTYRSRDGYGRRLATDPGGVPTTRVIGREGGLDDIILRAGIEADLTDKLQLYATFDYTHNRDQQIPGEIRVVTNNAGLTGLYNALVAGPAGVPVTSALNSAGRYNNYNTGVGFSNQDIYGGQATLTYTLSPAVTIKSITGYRNTKSDVARDGDGTAANLLASYAQLRQNQTSEELQVLGNAFDDRLTWIVGGYYLHENANEPEQGIVVRGLYRALEALPGAVIPLGPGINAGGAGNPFNAALDLDFLYQNYQQTDSYAAFGQATFKITPKLSVTGGLRYTRESKLFRYSFMLGESGTTVVPTSSNTNTYTDLSPRIGIEYKASADTLLYASYSQGFKSGGFNGRSTTALQGLAFEPEKVKTFEGGIKSDFLDHRVRFNLAGFYNDYTNVQVQVLLPVSSGSLTPVTINAARGRIYGGEAELTLRPVRNFDLGLALGYQHARYTELSAAARANGLTTDSRFARVPEFTLSTYGQYRHELADGNALVARVDYSYRSKVFNDAANTPEVAQPGYGLLSARLALQVGTRWEFAVYGQNLTDEYYITGGLNLLPSGFGVYNVQRAGLPRTFGGSVRLKF